MHIRLPIRWTTLWQASAVLAFSLSSVLAQTSSPSPQTPAIGSPAATPPAADSSQPQVLDRVIAIINGDVLLESDVQEEMLLAAIQPISIQRGQNSPRRAAERLINRTLILQQMKDQQSIAPVTDEEVQKSLDDLKKQIPTCAKYLCTTPQGWKAFLKDNNLTEQQVQDRWRQRQQILQFINVRFQAGIRISKSDIQNYYDKTLTAAFTKENVKPPSVESITPRIQEILLQQRVNVLLQDWLKSLRDQGSVQILDPAYGQTTDQDDDTGGSA
jgi:peptidyl-prolyl cis-trans isomerase SurA